MISRSILAGLGLALLAVGPTASAQSSKAIAAYPSKPVRIVVGFPPGSATDVAARRVAIKMGESLGATFIIENKAGASGSIAAAHSAKAEPDGYTLYAGTTSEIAINRPGGLKINYDPEKDFMPIGILFTTNPVLVSAKAFKGKTFEEMVAIAKANPETVNWATVNAFQQVVLGSVQRSAGIKFNEIPYRGTALAMADVVGNQVDGMVAYPAEASSNINAGRANALAIVGTKRNPFLPDTPTMGQLGYEDLDLIVWGGFFAPAGTPPAIVEKINKALLDANRQADVVDALAKTGSEVRLYSVKEFENFITSEIKLWERLVKETGVVLR